MHVSLMRALVTGIAATLFFGGWPYREACAEGAQSPFAWGSSLAEVLRQQPGLIEQKLEVTDLPPSDVGPPPEGASQELRDFAKRRKEAAARLQESMKKNNTAMREMYKTRRQFKTARPWDLFGLPVGVNFNFEGDRLESVVYATDPASDARCAEQFDLIVAGLAKKYGPPSSRDASRTTREADWSSPAQWIGVTCRRGDGCACWVTYLDPKVAAARNQPAPAPY